MDPSEQIDRKIAALADWRGERIAQARAVIRAAEPDLEEAWKWNTGMWTVAGKLVCGFGAFKEHVKINFMQGAHLPDPGGLFNNGFDAQESRSLDLRKDDKLEEAALTQLVHDAVAYCSTKGS